MYLVSRLLCFFLASLFFSNVVFAKVRLFTFHNNRPQFIEYQYATFKKFILDDYEWIVINDASSVEQEKAIREVCEKYGIACVRYVQDWHKTDPINEWIRANVNTDKKNSWFKFPQKNGALDLDFVSQQCSVRHSHLIQYALENFGYNHDDIVAIVDGDVFPIKPISLRNLLVDVPIAGLDHMDPGSSEGDPYCSHYLCSPFLIFDPTRLPDVNQLKFHVGFIDGVLLDTGSYSQTYLEQHPEVPYRLYPRRTGADFSPWDYTAFEKHGLPYAGLTKINWPTYFEFYVDSHFVHFMRGSDLARNYENDHKISNMRILIESVLHDELEAQYQLACTTPSDINEHISVLRSLAAECSSVVEMGVRSMVSSWGILKGLSESKSRSRSYIGIDINPPPLSIFNLAKEFSHKNNISFVFCQGHNKDIDINPTEMLFIDTLHVYFQLTYELEKFSPKVSKYIAMHDTGDTDTYEDPNPYYGDRNVYPGLCDPNKRGMWQAVLDFLERHPEWVLQERRTNNYGFTVLKRVNNET
jgi:hypothetical protein